MNDTETKTSPEIEAAIKAAQAGDWMPAVTLWLADDNASRDDFQMAHDDEDGFWDEWYSSDGLYDNSIVDLQLHFESWCLRLPSAEVIVGEIGECLAQANDEWHDVEHEIFTSVVSLYVAEAVAIALAISDLRQETEDQLEEQVENLLGGLGAKNRLPEDRLYERLMRVELDDMPQGEQVSAFLRATMVAAGIPYKPKLYQQIMLLLANASDS